MSETTSQTRESQTREERLAARLRENLRRRKAQARALEAGEAGDSPEPEEAGQNAGLSKPQSDR